MSKIKSLLYIFIFAGIAVIISAQQINPLFEKITVDNGLSQNTINSVLQDKYGFMWFGSQDGLNRFDGYEFKIYRNNPADKNSLSNNYIWKILEDKNGTLWIGTFGGGLNKYDPSTNLFSHFTAENSDDNSLTDSDVFEIIEYPTGTLWIGTGNGLNKLDIPTGKIKQFEKFFEIEKSKNPTNYIRSIVVSEPDNIWFNSSEGLSRLNISSEEIEHFQKDPFGGNIEFGIVRELFADKNLLYVLCDAGLIELDFKAMSAKILLTYERVQKITGPGFLFSEFYKDENNLFWLGTTNALLIYNPNSDELQFYQTEDSNLNSLSHNSVLSFCKSKGDVLWIGTQSGISKLNKINNEFGLVKRLPGRQNTISGKGVGPIIEDSYGYIWLGTRSPEALDRLDKDANEVRVFKNEKNNKASLSANYILSLYEDKKRNIWVGTKGGGLNKISYSEMGGKNILIEKIKPIPQKNEDPIIERIQYIYEDKDGLLWLGTSGTGIYAYNVKTNIVKSYPYATNGSGPNHTHIYSILEDRNNNFWIGTATGGLNLMDRKNGKFIYFTNNPAEASSLSNDIVLCIYESSRSNLWFGTSRGLNKLVTKNEKNLFSSLNNTNEKLVFKRYGMANEFPNEVIYGILEDDNGNLWLSTNKGIIVFDPIEENVITTYDVTDGLQNNEFNQNSYFKNKDGIMYFGGIGGYNRFNPTDITDNKFAPPIVITDFKLYNKSVPVKINLIEEEYSIEKNIFALHKIELLHEHKVFSFEFSALNFSASEKNEYAYMMEGFDKDWIYAGRERSTTYTNLDPGDYVFRVKGSNNNGVWNEKGTYLNIRIEPPWWQTWWAYSIYGLLFLSGIFLLVKIRERELKREIEVTRKIEAAKAEERINVRTKTSQDFHDEAGNKLTKITLFTSLAKKEAKENPVLKEYLTKIQENTKELSGGMRDFLWVLDAGKDSLYDMAKRMEDFGNSMFESTDVHFSVRGVTEDSKKIILPMEVRRSLILIFKEAINNSLKYSQAENVIITISFLNNVLTIKLNDDGLGFVITEKSDGYGLNNMKARAEKLNGKLEIFSSEGKGTEIIFIGNITQMGN